VGVTASVLFAAMLGSLAADQVAARQHFDRTHAALDVTQRRTHTVAAHLAELSRDLSLLRTQVGSDSTALTQDSAQLLGAQTSLSAAQAHVTRQASLITSLQTCLVGVERALNALAVGDQPDAIAALNAVSASCTAAEAASG
jgi:small-conductance mechanosensitive channel